MYLQHPFTNASEIKLNRSWMYLQTSDLTSSNRYLPEYRLNRTRVQTQEHRLWMRNMFMRKTEELFPTPVEVKRSLVTGFSHSWLKLVGSTLHRVSSAVQGGTFTLHGQFRAASLNHCTPSAARGPQKPLCAPLPVPKLLFPHNTD